VAHIQPSETAYERADERADEQADEQADENKDGINAHDSEQGRIGWWVYVLRCADDTLYTGCAKSIERRLCAHQKGSAKYTRSRLPVELVYAEPAQDKSAALRREAAIKKWSRAKKLALCEAGSPTKPSASRNGVG
jgi:predicted GIY-YIG superfamily endonuclease